MNNNSISILQKLNAELASWSKQLDGYTHERLNQPAANGGWSAMQCIQHLMLSESGSMGYIMKKLSFAPDLPEKGLSDIWKRMLLVGYLKSPIKFKAPKGIGTEYIPRESELPSTLLAWQAQRQQMEADLKSIDPQYFSKRVFKHPMAGRVSIDTTFAFLNAHFQRHRQQAMRVLSEQNH